MFTNIELKLTPSADYSATFESLFKDTLTEVGFWYLRSVSVRMYNAVNNVIDIIDVPIVHALTAARLDILNNALNEMTYPGKDIDEVTFRKLYEHGAVSTEDLVFRIFIHRFGDMGVVSATNSAIYNMSWRQHATGRQQDVHYITQLFKYLWEAAHPEKRQTMLPIAYKSNHGNLRSFTMPPKTCDKVVFTEQDVVDAYESSNGYFFGFAFRLVGLMHDFKKLNDQ